MSEIIYAVDLTVYVPGTGVTTLYYATNGVVFNNQYYEPRLKQPGNFSQNIFSDGRTGGASQTGYGEIVLLNPDGGLDPLITYGFDGRPLILRKIVDGVGSILMSCSMEQPTPSWTEVPIRIKDKQQLFNVAIQPTKYIGDNVLPDGLEGSDDIKGQPKPILYGVVNNLTPVCVNTSRLIYQCSDTALAALSAVRDRGVPLAADTAYTTQAEMFANPPVPGTYRVYLAGGVFRLGSLPTGAVTCDAVEGSTAGLRTAAQIAKRVALRVITAGEMDLTDIAALDTANNAEVGIYVKQEATVAAVLDEILSSVGAWYGFNSVGVLNMGRLEAPIASPSLATFTNAELLDIQRRATNDTGRGIPPYKINLGYDKNYTVQDATSLAGSAREVLSWAKYSRPTGWLTSTYEIYYGNGVALKSSFVTGSTATHLLLTSDGASWEQVTVSGNTYTTLGIAFGNGIFLWVGKDAADAPFAFKSSNGRTWTTVTAPPIVIEHLTYGAGVFVGLGATGNVAAVSANGTSWSSQTIANVAHTGIIFGGETFFTFTSGSATAYRSNDAGVTWTAVTLPSASIWSKAAYGSGVFCLLAATSNIVAVGGNDALGWSQSATPPNSYSWTDIVYGDDKFIMVGPAKFVATSTNGTLWVQVPITLPALPPSQWYLDVLSWVAIFYSPTIGFICVRSGSASYAIYGNQASTGLMRHTKEYRRVSEVDSTVLTKHPNSQEFNLNTLLVTAAKAQIEAYRLLQLYKVDRDLLSIKVHSSVVPADILGRVVTIKVPRYGYTNGKLFRVIGIRYDYEMGFTTLDIWG